MVYRFRIVRYFRNSDRKITIMSGLSEEEARAHCRDSEASSFTATGKAAKARTRKHGAWFDGYTDQ
jgi:hypothetical protein